MKPFTLVSFAVLLGFTAIAAEPSVNTFGPEPKVPRFSIEYMDRTVEPGADFYKFAAGNWVRNNPVPADKSRWGSFTELAERNSYLIRGILEDAAADKQAPAKSPRHEVGDFYASA